MEQPETGLQKFMRSKTAPYVGMLIAAVMALLFVYTNIITTCFGGIMVAVLLYVVPKSMGADAKKLAVFGVIIFIAMSVFSALYVSKPMMLDHEGTHGSNGFTDIQVTPFRESDNVVFTATYAGATATTELTVEYREVTNVWAGGWSHGKTAQTVPNDNPAGSTAFENTLAPIALGSGKAYSFQVVAVDGTDRKTSEFYLGPITMSDSQLTTFCLQWNFYAMALNMFVFFVLILLFTTWMRKNLDRTRERLEREGRLYPPGYGRCKECGTVVLPGEVVCRKCGTYIDIPEELKVKKVEYFECSECGKEVPAGADVCPACGAAFDGTVDEEPNVTEQKAAQTFTCSECKKEVAADAEVCPHCGERFEN